MLQKRIYLREVEPLKKEMIYVVGHKNPDTDSICSAIAMAELMKERGYENVSAARAGDINPQTAFVLDYFGVQPPRYIPDVYPKAKDIMTTEIITVDEDIPLFEALEIIRGRNIRFVPVVDEAGRPKGVLTLMELAKRNIAQIEPEKSRKVTTSIRNIVRVLGAKVVSEREAERCKTFSVYVGAMGEDSFLKVLGEEKAGECIVIVGDREEIQRASVEKGVALLIVTGGLEVKRSIAEAAIKKGVSVVISPFDSATTAIMVRMSIPSRLVCRTEFEHASPDDLVEDIKRRMAGSSERGLVVLNEKGVICGIITKSNLLRPSGISLVLVDHNELSQAVDGAESVRIMKVVDHHRLGNFHTTQPITFICEPVGSTSTLVAEIYKRTGTSITKKTAGLLLGGVLSDTVMLKSPTTTERDREIVPWLEERACIDHEVFGREMFMAASSIKKRGAAAVVKGDYKIFEAKGRKFGVGQVETIGFEEFYDEKERLAEELGNIRKEKGLKLSALLVTDIVRGTSLLLAVGDKEIIYNLDYPRIDDGVYELRNVLSRKKQVAPHLLGIFNEIY